MKPVILRTITLDTPIGPLSLGETDLGIFRIHFDTGEGFKKEEAIGHICLSRDPLRYSGAQQIMEYFKGLRKTFNLPLDLKGTPFQHKVWAALSTIPYGETRSYRDIGIQAGSPRGARAVGQANGANPIPIIIPCHRVIAADGAMGGFAWGLPVKQHLLELEREYR